MSALSRLSIVHANRLDFEAALAFGERALRSSDALHDEHAEAMAMDALKQVALQTGDFETLERLAARLTLIHRRNDDLWMLQFAVEEVAYADLARMRLDRAFAGMDEGLAINRRIGDIGNEPMYLATLGRAHRARGDYDEALAVGRRAFDLARELGHGEWTGWAAAWLGATLVELDAFGEAARAARRRAPRRPSGRTRASIWCDAWGRGRGPRSSSASASERSRSPTERRRSSTGSASGRRGPGSPGTTRTSAWRAFGSRPASPSSPRSSCRRSSSRVGRAGGATASWTARSCSRRRRSRRGTPAVAVLAAEHALEEALRTGLPTVWRAQRAAARAYRAAGDEKRATEHAAEAERAFARVVEGIHDRSIREALVSASNGGPSSEGVER